MGCYDTLRVRCPKCASPIDFQTKAGDCRLERYSVRNVPPNIAGALDGESGACDACGHVVQLHVQTIVTIGAPGDEGDSWDD